ncbi:MAG: dockerin type I repeat-containing protein [Oscillospiraceae bacterium]
MKKIFTTKALSIVMTIVLSAMIISMGFTTSFAITSEKYKLSSACESYANSSHILGDVSGDGRVSSGDAVLVLRYEAQLIQLSPEQIVAADVTADGRVSSGDAIKILRYEAQLIDSLTENTEVGKKDDETKDAVIKWN